MKKGFVILLLIVMLAMCPACGKTGITTSISDETQKEDTTSEENGQQEEQKEDEKEKKPVNPITNGGNFDVGNNY